MQDYLQEVELIKPVIAEAAKMFVLPLYGKLKHEDIIREGRFDKAVTTADVRSSEFVVGWARNRFPGSFSEEHIYEDRFDHDIVWCGDMLDGTDEFKHGHEGFCMQASLLVKRNDYYFPAAGLIYLPLQRIFVYATESDGPFVDDNGRIKKAPVPKQDRIIATQRAMDYSPELDAFYDFLRDEGQDVEVIKTGGAGATFAQMIIGHVRPNLYMMPRPYTKEWDLSQAENPIAMAGGFITDLYGNRYTYNRHDPKNPNGYVCGIGRGQSEVIGWLQEFGVENILKPRD